MKTIKIIRIITIALIVGFISTFTVNAASPAAVTAKNIRQKFAEVFQNPNDREDIPTTGTVVVIFKVNDEGKIEIKKLESNDNIASDFVSKKISGIPCKDYIYPYNQFYTVKFRFDQN
jgi:hypothetical protein